MQLTLLSFVLTAVQLGQAVVGTVLCVVTVLRDLITIALGLTTALVSEITTTFTYTF